MRQFFALVVAFCAFFVVAPVAFSKTPEGDPDNVQELVAEVEKTYANVNTLRADYVMTQRGAAGEVKQKGKLVMKRPRMLKFDTTKEPNGSLYVSDGQKIYLYTPSAKQVFVLKDLSGADSLNLLEFMAKLDEKFNVELRSKESGADKKAYLVVLTPKDPAFTYKEIRIQISRKKYELQSVVLVDAYGTETEYAFSGFKMNSEVPDSEFVFTPPAGVEVIDQSGGI